MCIIETKTINCLFMWEANTRKMDVYIYVYVYVYTCVYNMCVSCICIFVHTCVYKYIHIYIYIYIYICTYMCVYIHIYQYANMYIFVYTHIQYTHIHIHIYTHTHTYVCMSICKYANRVAKTRRIPYLYTSFSAKEPYIEWLFCGNDLQLRGSYESSPPCNYVCIYMCADI